MSDRIPEQSEYRNETELITYPEYNLLNEKAEPGPEYSVPENDLPAEAGARPSRFGKLIVSAFKAGGAAVCALILIGAIAGSHGKDMGKPSEKLGQGVEAARKPAISLQKGYSPGAFRSLWRGDPEGPHNYDLASPINLKTASCTEDGAAEYLCLDCGVRQKLILPATGHDPGDPVRENSVAPDCTQGGGYEETVCCRTCGGPNGALTVT